MAVKGGTVGKFAWAFRLICRTTMICIAFKVLCVSWSVTI